MFSEHIISDAVEKRRIAPISVANPKVREKSPGRTQMALKTLRFFSRCGVSIACCIFVFMLTLFSAARLSAQTAGQISGHVTDTTGAVIPGATVTLSNPSTNTSRTTTTNGTGDYLFYAVPPATYNLRVTKSGFQAATTPDVQVAVQASLALNFQLHVGAVSTSVTVAASGALLQANNPTLGTVVPTQTVSQMPLNNRNYLGLVALSANANTISPSQGQAGSREGGRRSSESISVGGQRIMYDHYMLDGINNTDVDFNSFVVQPSVDAISQFKVQTGVYPAQFGYNATQINVVTKSGGNHYHGTAFEFLRNNYADALGYNYAYPQPFPAVLPYKYNDYGFVLSGPLTIPHVFNGKNKFFFMVNDEWYSQVDYSATFRTQPTSAILGGDFSNFTTTKGGPVIPIYDPTTGNADGTGRSQFECNGVMNVICPSRIDPVSQRVVSLYYAPAQTSAFSDNYQLLSTGRDDHDGFNVRGDYYQSANSQWAFRFSNGLETDTTAGFTTPGGTTGDKVITKYYQYMGSNTWTISPTIVNVATFGWTNFYNSKGEYSANTDNDVAKIDIPGLQPGLPVTWGIPDFGFTGSNYNGIGDSSGGPFVTSDPDVSVNDNLSVVKGKHSFDMGFEYDRQTFNELGNQFSRGNFVFHADQTAQLSSPGVLAPNTGSAFASFLLGDIYQATYAVQIADANYVRNVEGVYFDDNYKVTPKLSFQMGLRYELTPPWYNTLGQEFIVDLETNHTPIAPDVSGPEPKNLWPIFMRQGNCQDPYHGINIRWVEADKTTPVSPAPECANGNFPDSMMATDYTNWAPRIGVSYSPTPTWVIRAGYGMYYNHDIGNARFDMARNLAGRVTLLSGGGAIGATTLNFTNAVGSGGIAKVPPPYSFSTQFSHKTSYSEVWLLDIQKQLGTNWSIEAGYLGMHSGNLAGFRNPNYSIPYGLLGPAGYYPNGSSSGTCTAALVSDCGAPKSIADRTPYPNYGVVQMVHDVGRANYDAFSLQINKRFSNGFNLISSYTFSKALDDTSGIRTQSSELFPQDDRCVTCEYGPSDFDVRHRVVASAIYSLPIGQQAGAFWRPSSRLVNAVVGGWQYNVVATLQTGSPYNIGYIGNNPSTNTVAGGTPSLRPNYVSGQSFLESHPTAGDNGQWVNPGAWQEPAPGFLGDTSRNMLTAPGYADFDMAIDKNFAMPYNENHKLQIRFDAFNAFNHTNFGTPFKYINISSIGGKVISTNGNQRELQLAARYTF